MRLLWINEHASFIGGCERYIADTALLLKEKGIVSTLLYDPNKPVDPSLLASFDEAFPLVNLKDQLASLNPDLIFLHQFWDTSQYQYLIKHPAPVIRFYHDYRIFCLRKFKITTIKKKPCKKIAGPVCIPCLGFINRASNPLGFTIKTLNDLYNEQAADRLFDGFLVGSSYMQDHTVAHGFPPEKVKMIPLYARRPEEIPHVKRERNLIAYAGQLVRGKGLDVAIEALKELPSEIQLEVAGKGRQEEMFRNMARAFGVEDRVHFLGQLPIKKLNELYCRATCLIHPCRYPEPFGLIGPEAMRFGTPVIASKLGGIPEWLDDGVTGILVPTENPKSLAHAITKITEDSSLATQFGKQAKKSFLERFTPDKHIEELTKYFDEITNQTHAIGTFTVDGSDEVERVIYNMVMQVSNIIEKMIPEKDRVTLALMGGYGKGEGGIKSNYPHNNIDFILILENISSEKQIKYSEEVKEVLNHLREEFHIGIDFSIIRRSQIENSAPLLIWHDLISGHKTLLGDPNYIPSLPFGDPSNILPRDIFKLLVNRGSLLIINDWLADNGVKEKVQTKHIMKAIIGYGDALLFYLGDYNWSYQEKRRRMQKRDDIPKSFRDLYETASKYRLNPNDQIEFDPNQIRETLKEIFLQCESMRLDCQNLTWDNYFQKALHYTLSERLKNPREFARGIKGFSFQSFGGDPVSNLSFKLSSPDEKMSFIFPIIAFDIGDKSAAKVVLDAKDESIEELRKAYLRKWGVLGDIHFFQSVQKWGVTL